MTVTIPKPAAEHTISHAGLKEKDGNALGETEQNPVVTSTRYAFEKTDLVQVSDGGVKSAAQYIYHNLKVQSYTPRTWRTHPLHICPPEPYNPSEPLNKSVFDWIFLISSLNFNFWSEKEGSEERFGVEWQEGWEGAAAKNKMVHTGYWSLVAALDRAMADDGIPITDPKFYSSEILCPDSLIEHVFRPAESCLETIPLLQSRIAIMREVGHILCTNFGGSFKGFMDAFQSRYNNEGTALQLVKMVVDTFPSFRDEVWYEGRKVYLWKRAQILVAETWAAFYPPSPPSPSNPHPLFPGARGASIHQLTMFADYRVPQILHHLRILEYPPSLLSLLHSGAPLEYGSREELSLRAASIVAVERVREEICLLMRENGEDEDGVTSVLIDFYLWDLAKEIETGDGNVEGVQTAAVAPIHRTRSIWY
ncbi:Queuosine 5'-phosphate N-glycosylase/hydrolase [Pleurotus pulmonarius]|nr:hypothetical protein EYR36_004913 [Pleurotus pulmonarius]